MAVVGQSCSVNTYRIVLIGLVTLLITAMAALIFGFEQYLTIGQFFQLRDILHHEAFMVSVLAFGSGVFLASVGFALYHRNQAYDLIQYPNPAGLPYHQQFPYQTYQMPSAPQERRYYLS